MASGHSRVGMHKWLAVDGRINKQRALKAKVWVNGQKGSSDMEKN